MRSNEPQPSSPTVGVESAGSPFIVADDQRVADARSRRGEHYANRLAIFLEDTPTRQPGGIVFVGDSITERFPVEAAFPDRLAVNRGIGGDKIDGVLDRLDVSIERLSPSRVYLMIGTNNILFPGESTMEEQLSEYDRLLAEVKRSARRADVTVISVPALAGNFTEKNPQVAAFNKLAREVARKHGFSFVDLTPWMTDESGGLAPEYTNDGVHFTMDGYQAWLEAIVPFEEYVRAASNLAPLVRESHRTEYPANAVNAAGSSTYGGGRGPDQLIVFTPAYGRATTGTNQWGIEVIVRSGKVTQVGGNNSAIPPDGFVISGHGKAATWIQAMIQPGISVVLENGVVRVTPAPAGEQTPPQRVRSLQRQALDAVSLLNEAKNATSAHRREARALLETTHRYRADREAPDAIALEVLEARMKALHESIQSRL